MDDNNKINLSLSKLPTDKSELNPAGSTRRRLMRLLGGPGAAALTGLIASGWQKPIVESVILPAHAQTSEDSEDGDSEGGVSDPPCTWSVQLNLANQAIIFQTLAGSILMDGSVLVASETNSAGGLFIAAFGTHDPSDYHEWGFSYQQLGNPTGEMSALMTVSASCCTDNSATNTLVGISASNGMIGSLIGLSIVDGMCSVIID